MILDLIHKVSLKNSCFLPVFLLSAVSAQAAAADTRSTVPLQILELPFLLIVIAACFLTSWLLFRRDDVLPARLIAKALLLYVVGFSALAIAHVLAIKSGIPDDFFAVFAEVGWEELLWMVLLLTGWALLAIGVIVILGFVVRERLEKQAVKGSGEEQSVQKNANIDPLTHIWNRRFLFRDGEALIDQLKN